MDTRVSERQDPIVLFRQWLAQAIEADENLATAMLLVTTSADFVPSSRIVLLKDVENGEFIFFTNYNSQKGQELIQYGKASLMFNWNNISKRVEIMGTVSKTDDRSSDEYFDSRPRKSQLGAWASQQSSYIKARNSIITAFVRFYIKYIGRKVKRPPHWGGFKLKPVEMTFSEANTLAHYTNSDGKWLKG